MAISMEESEQLLLALWEMNHRGEEDQMQFRVMIDELNDLIEVGVWNPNGGQDLWYFMAKVKRQMLERQA